MMTKKKTGFYYLKTAYDISPRNDIKIVLGDHSGGQESCQFSHKWQSQSSHSHKPQWIPADTVCSIAEYDNRINIPPT